MQAAFQMIQTWKLEFTIKSIMGSLRKQTRKLLQKDGTIYTKENQEKAVMYDCIMDDSSEIMQNDKNKCNKTISRML